MDEAFFLLLGICGLAIFFVPIILVIVLWSKVSRLQQDVQLLDARVKRGLAAAPAPTVPRPKPETVAPEEIEIVEAPPRPIPSPILSPRPRQPIEVPMAAAAVVPENAAAEEPATAASETKSFSLEELLAGRWLTWVGALAVIIGAGLFFKYAVENDYIDENGRVMIGLVLGMAAFAGAAYSMLRDYRWLGQALAGAAAGVLYFSLFAAFDFYDLIPQGLAFTGMVLVTAAVLAFSTIFNSQPTAILGLIGGFLTPLMLSTGHDRQWELFSYLFILDLGVLGIASFRKWQPLQITAFCFTLIMWVGWFSRFWEPEKLTSTIILMTAFFLLFALLGVWHNALRRLPAKPGDFFLMLATPIVYFIALYAVTKQNYADWHGLMAVGLAGSYLGLAVLQMARNPAGKMVIVCLAGVAASFLTVAVPLQLTGHWIAIAWAAESLLLVELGLRFGQPKLRWTGFGLLFVVQLILMFYAGQTFDHPDRFTTRFTVDPVAADVMPYGMTAPQPVEITEPTWTDVFNGRSLSYLASAIVMSVLAWEYRRRKVSLTGEVTRTLEASGSLAAAPLAAGWLLALVPITVLAMLIVETFALGDGYNWIAPTYLGLFAVWGALTAVMVLLLSRWWGPAWLERVSLGVFGLVGLLLMISLLATLAGWRSEWSSLTYQGADAGLWRYPLINPRGIGFLAAIAAGAFAALMTAGGARREGEEDAAPSTLGALSLSSLLGLFAHLTGLVMLTTEVYAQGIVQGWDKQTALSITIVWLLYAIATMVAGIYYRSATIRILALSLFVLTTGKVFTYDVWHVSKAWKTVAFTALGVALLLVSFVYRRYRERIRAWITNAAIVTAAVTLGLAGDRAFAQENGHPTDPLETLQHRWAVPDSLPDADPRGLIGLTLPPDLYGLTRNDLADVRVIAVENESQRHLEIPFVLIQPHDHDELTQRTVPLLNLSQVGGRTQFLLDVGEESEPVREIEVEVAAAVRNYERSVSILGADRRDAEDASWALLTDEGYLLDRTRDAHQLRVGRIEFSRSQFRFYKVVIDNAGAPPLEVTGAKVADRERVRVPRREYHGEVLSRQQDAEHKTTRVLIDLGYDRLPTLGLRVDVDFTGDYHRTVQLEQTDTLGVDEKETRWRHVATFDLYRIDRPGRRPAYGDGITYGEARGRFLRLTIDNGDDQPLHIAGVTALAIDRLLVCERARLSPEGSSLAVYAGDNLLTAPRYDLARTVGTIEPNALPPVATLAASEANPFFRGPTKPKLPWSEEHKPLLWTLTIAGVVVLGGLTALLLWKAARKAPPTGTWE